MKKALLLIGLIAIFLPGYAQTLNPSPSTIPLGGTLISSISGNPLVYAVPASKFTSLISQADADTKAQADISANSQNYTNRSSTCIPVPYIDSGSGWRGQVYTVYIENTSEGDTIEWEILSNAATIIDGQGSRAIVILLKKIGGTLPYTFTITAKVTSINGVMNTYTAPFISKFCGLCPQ